MSVAAAALAAACCTLVGVYEGASNWTVVMVRCLTQSLTAPCAVCVCQQQAVTFRTQGRFVSAMTLVTHAALPNTTTMQLRSGSRDDRFVHMEQRRQLNGQRSLLPWPGQLYVRMLRACWLDVQACTRGSLHCDVWQVPAQHTQRTMGHPDGTTN